jgi:hypothetical protein
MHDVSTFNCALADTLSGYSIRLYWTGWIEIWSGYMIKWGGGVWPPLKNVFNYIQNCAFWGVFKVVYKCMKKKVS